MDRNRQFDPAIELLDGGLVHLPHRPGTVAPSGDEAKFFDELERQNFSAEPLGNESLPVFKYKDEIIRTVADNQVTIIVAPTGTGKSTQTPQYLHEAGWDTVYMTQPRRAAARNVFNRITEEIIEKRGYAIGEHSTSLQTGEGKQGGNNAPIRVETDGLRVVYELNGKGAQDNDVLIIDEVHEWGSNVEVLVAWAKKAIVDKPNLRVVLMSATMDAHSLAYYFKEVTGAKPPVINIEGSLHEVTNFEHPESTIADVAIEKVLARAHTKPEEGSGDILIFVPGKGEIKDTIAEIDKRLPFYAKQSLKVFPLHAKLSPKEQQDAIRQHPGYRRIVVATNIAQTSLTIPGIDCVIDSGLHRQIETDDEGVQGLEMSITSIADCDQRAGRTGRVCAGEYHLAKLNNGTPFTPKRLRPKFPKPEIVRTDVSRNTLRLAAVDLDIAEFDLYHPLSLEMVDIAKYNLQILGALSSDTEIASLGRQMNEYPLCTSSARIMIESERYNERIRAYAAAITASKEAGGLQLFGRDVGTRWKSLTSEGSSDLLVQLDLFMAARTMLRAELFEHDLDINNVERAKEHYKKIVKLAGVAITEDYDGLTRTPTDQDREGLVNCIVAGYLTSVYQITDSGEYTHAYNERAKTPRESSNRSMVDARPELIVGDPYRIQYFDGPDRKVRHSIENVTVTTTRTLGRVATEQTVWEHDSYRLREGKITEEKRQYLFGFDLGLIEEVPATPSVKLREEIIQIALDNPGSELKRIRGVKAELEALAHRAQGHVPVLTHDRIIHMVKRAASETITNPCEIEDNLRAAHGTLTRATFVSDQQYEYIIANSPDEITIADVPFYVAYRNKKPRVKHPDIKTLLQQDDDVYLADGRLVTFYYRPPNKEHGKFYSLMEIRAIHGQLTD